MKLTCRYCGYSVDYPNGVGWFAGKAHEITQHVMDKHVKVSFIERRGENGEIKEISYGAFIEPGYSATHSETFRSSLTVTQEDRLKPPPYDGGI